MHIPTPTPVRRLPTPTPGQRLDRLLRRAVPLQLAGTFLVLRPDVAFVDGNPLLLSVDGEYVVKNLVLLAATAALALHTLSPRPDATTAHRLPDAHDPAHSTPTQRAA
jgi:hypothetical protein